MDEIRRSTQRRCRQCRNMPLRILLMFRFVIESKTLQGQTVYVDCNGDLCWTPTYASNKTWGPSGNEDGSWCTDLGPTYPACDYCDTLTWGGFTDWRLPLNSDLLALCSSASCPAPHKCFGGDGYSDRYWTRTEFGTTTAYFTSFNTCINGNFAKTTSYRVRCVRP